MIHNITQADIDAGEPGMCSDCPVALSLLRHYDVVMVSGGSKIMTCLEGREFEYHDTPKKVARFIQRFDAYETVEPMEFECGD